MANALVDDKTSLTTIDVGRYDPPPKKKPSKSARTKSSYASTGVGRSSNTSAVIRAGDEDSEVPNHKRHKKKIKAPSTVD